MQAAIQIVVLLLGAAFLALVVYISGRAMAKTRIRWSLCFKYAAIVMVSMLPIRALAASLGPSGYWIGLPLGIVVQVMAGAFYLGSRAKKESGYDLGPITGAKVGAGVAF